MTLNSLIDFSQTVSKLVEVFGAPAGFKEEYHNRIVAAQAIVEEELGKSLGQISSRVGFGERGIAALKEVKKWVAETYKFPEQ